MKRTQARLTAFSKQGIQMLSKIHDPTMQAVLKRERAKEKQESVKQQKVAANADVKAEGAAADKAEPATKVSTNKADKQNVAQKVTGAVSMNPRTKQGKQANAVMTTSQPKYARQAAENMPRKKNSSKQDSQTVQNEERAIDDMKAEDKEEKLESAFEQFEQKPSN